jgi:photosystem II stability/assembly factor-like uncharacterized protein
MLHKPRLLPGRRRAVVCLAACLGAGLAGAIAAAPGGARVLADALDTAVQPAAKLHAAASAVDRHGDRLVAVGARGGIFVSADGAATWTQSPSPVASDLVGARFVDATTVWAVGHDGVALQSGDSGRSWQRVLDGRSVLTLMQAHYGALAKAGNAPAALLLREVQRSAEQSATPGVLPSPFFDIWFADAQEGLLVGAFGLMLRTRDGGKTWVPILEQTDNERRYHLYAMQGQGAERWVAGEQGLLMRWDAASDRFVQVETPYNGSFFGISVQPGAIVAYGLRGNAWLSRDDGAQWRKLDTGTDTALVAAQPLEGRKLLLVSQSSELFVLDLDSAAVVPVKKTVPAGEVVGAVTLGAGRVVLARPGGVLAVELPRAAD